jgi:hypothetical protein
VCWPGVLSQALPVGITHLNGSVSHVAAKGRGGGGACACPTASRPCVLEQGMSGIVRHSNQGPVGLTSTNHHCRYCCAASE